MTMTTSLAWRRALGLLLPLLLLLLWLARDSVAAMVHVWSSSETFAHGFVVPLISLWLIWRQRATLASYTPRPELRWLLVLLLAAAAWLMAELVAVNVVAQFALVSMLVALVATLLGRQLVGQMLFPLAFLFFAVPFGEFALPQLMDWTARFTVWALRLTGVPVYQEGLSFIIPSGRWSVVEACSGVRYLIASLVVGSLYAYLNYVSLRRRLIFIAVSFIVPIIANWLRAYMIVMLGHVSDNQLAAGVDHLIYGWLFFGVVIMLMFWIGARWREDVQPAAAEHVMTADAATTPPSPPVRWQLVAVCSALAVLAAPLTLHWLERDAQLPTPQLTSLTAPAGWSASAAPFVAWQPSLQAPDAELHQGFSIQGAPLDVHVAYYQQQRRDHKLISSVNVLVPSSDPYWRQLDTQAQTLELMGLPLTLRSAVIKGEQGEHLLVWQLYWIGGQWVASELKAKLMTARNLLAGQGEAAAQLVLATPLDLNQPAAAQTRLGQSLQQLAPQLDSHLRQAHGAGQ